MELFHGEPFLVPLSNLIRIPNRLMNTLIRQMVITVVKSDQFIHSWKALIPRKIPWSRTVWKYQWCKGLFQMLGFALHGAPHSRAVSRSLQGTFPTPRLRGAFRTVRLRGAPRSANSDVFESVNDAKVFSKCSAPRSAKQGNWKSSLYGFEKRSFASLTLSEPPDFALRGTLWNAKSGNWKSSLPGFEKRSFVSLVLSEPSDSALREILWSRTVRKSFAKPDKELFQLSGPTTPDSSKSSLHHWHFSNYLVSHPWRLSTGWSKPFLVLSSNLIRLCDIIFFILKRWKQPQCNRWDDGFERTVSCLQHFWVVYFQIFHL